MNPLGKLIRRYRKKHGWTQLDLLSEIAVLIDDSIEQGVLCEEEARKARIKDRAIISLWESGKRIPRPQTIDILVQVFGLNDEEARELRSAAGEAKSRGYMPSGEKAPFQVPRDIPYFVGRKEEMDALEESLASGQAAVVCGITGMGGIGKSALAIHLAHVHRDLFPDGVLYASLRDSEPLAILASFAVAYGNDVSTIPDLSARAAAVCSILDGKHTLVVLDNTEEVDALRGVLAGCGARCCVLMTTRDVELVAAVTTGRAVRLAVLSKKESLDLLRNLAGEERVKGWEKAAGEVCELLDRLPLAVEIAGKLVGKLGWGMGRLRARLRDERERLGALKVKDLEVRTSFDLSCGMLEEKQRALFAALGVFGGQDFSAEAVAHVTEMSLEGIQDNLGKLYGLSLVQQGRPGRYRLHSLLRDYAREKNTDTDVFERMVEFFVSYVKSRERDYDALELESSNVLAALDVAFDRGMQTALVQGSNAFYHFLEVRGLYGLAETHLNRAEQVARTLGDATGLVTTLLNIGKIAEKRGNYTRAEAYYQKGLVLARESEQRERISALLRSLGTLAFYRTLYDQAEAYLQESLNLACEIGHRDRISDLLVGLGAIADKRGAFDQAEAYYQEGLAIARDLGHHETVSLLLQNLGVVAGNRGAYDQEEAYYQEALVIARELGYRERICALLGNLGTVAFYRGAYDQAEACYKEGLAQARELGHLRRICFLLHNLGELALKQGTYDQAGAHFQEGLALARELGHREMISSLLKNLAGVAVERGAYDQAEAYLQEAGELAREPETRWLTGRILVVWGELYLEQHSWSSATAAFREALEIAQELDMQDLVAEAKYGLAQVVFARGDIAEAQRLGQEGLAILEAMGLGDAAEVKEWLAGLPL